MSTSVFPLQKPKRGVMRKKRKERKTEREQQRHERMDWMKSSIQTGVVTNREFYELQTCWNGVPCVCSSSYRLAGSEGRVRASTLALRKNGLIHFPHERVSLGRHQTSQSTQIYGPLKQQASWPLCHRRLAAKTHTAPSFMLGHYSPSQAGSLIVHPLISTTFTALHELLS